MKILMVTNTFAPHVGGVARSVGAFSERYRELGHHVLVLCPSFEHTEPTRTHYDKYAHHLGDGGGHQPRAFLRLAGEGQSGGTGVADLG